MVSGGQKGELSCSTTQSWSQEESSITGPHRKRCTGHLLQEIHFPRNSARNQQHSELSLFANGLWFKTTPANFLLFLYKIMFLSFVRLAFGLCIACLSQVAILCCSRVNPFLLVEQLFHFEGQHAPVMPLPP